MKTQNSNSKKEKKLIGLWVVFWVSLALLFICMYKSEFSDAKLKPIKLNWKKKEAIELFPQEIPLYSKSEYAKKFLSENYLLVSEEGDFIKRPLPLEIIQDAGSGDKSITLSLIKESCYTGEEVYPWAKKYKIPSIVWKLPSGTQIGVSFSHSLITKRNKNKRDVAIERKGRYPVYSETIGNEPYLFDQNRKELLRW